MSFIGFLFQAFLGYFIIWPIVKLLLKVNAARRRYADMMNAMGGGMNNRARNDSRPGGWSGQSTTRRKKRIPDDTGEYIAFEEIEASSCTYDSNGRESSQYVREQQVEDAEWEEIR